MRFKEPSCGFLAPYPANNLTSAPACLRSTTGKRLLTFYESTIKGWDKHFLEMYPYDVSPTGSKNKHAN